MNKKTQALEHHVTAKNKIYGPTMSNCKSNFHVKYAKLNDFFGSTVGRYDKEFVNLIYFLCGSRRNVMINQWEALIWTLDVSGSFSHFQRWLPLLNQLRWSKLWTSQISCFYPNVHNLAIFEYDPFPLIVLLNSSTLYQFSVATFSLCVVVACFTFDFES